MPLRYVGSHFLSPLSRTESQASTKETFSNFFKKHVQAQAKSSSFEILSNVYRQFSQSNDDKYQSPKQGAPGKNLSVPQTSGDFLLNPIQHKA